MGDTSIEWTDKTWNPTRGCRRVSPGCEHCYAERQAGRFSGKGGAYDGLVKLVTRDVRQLKIVNGEPTGDLRTVTRSEARWTGETKFVTEHLADPLRWRKPCRVFVDSMSDLFYEGFTNEQIAAVFGVMAACPQHTFQVLTKRATRMREWFEWVATSTRVDLERHDSLINITLRHLPKLNGDSNLGRQIGDALHAGRRGPWPLPNVWLGVSVEDQQRADERIPELLRTPAAVRFLSCEPLLSALELRNYLGNVVGEIAEVGSARTIALTVRHGISWVIAGCESGPGARPCDVSWLRSLRDQCAAAGTAFFLKQAERQSLDRVCDADPIAPWPTGGFGPPQNGARSKHGGVIALPYLDGVQHAAFPRTR